MSGLFGRTLLAFRHCLGKIQSELSTTLKLSLSSFTRAKVYIIGLLHSHFINFNHGWIRNEPDDGGYSKRNQRQRVASKSLPNIAYSLFVPSVKRYSRNRFACKYHNHASAYSLQTVYCRFIFLHEENETQPTRTTEADCPDKRENFR